MISKTTTALNRLKKEKEHIIALLDEAYALRGSDLARGKIIAEKALQSSKELNDPELIALSLNKLALFCMIIADYDNALSMSEEAILHLSLIHI